MSSTDNLVKQARFLRNAAPQQFSDFYREFEEYSQVAATAMIFATENVQLYQGHAQQLVAILKALEDAKNG